MKIKVKAIAKINLGLNVVAKRNDGFHDLETIFYPINDLYDELEFERSNTFHFEDNYDFDNIILRAVELLENETKKRINVRISLKKNIPIGAGLGGGSSDAAITLKTLNTLFDLNIPKNTLREIAIELGSDVPFFIDPIPSIGKSRGEVLTPIDLYIHHPILLINPGINVSTKDAFATIHPTLPAFDYTTIIEYEVNNFKNFIVNDFENSVFEKHVAIKNIKIKMLSSGAVFSLMSGTGSTVYSIFNSLKEAEKCVSEFPNNYFSFISKPEKRNLN